MKHKYWQGRQVAIEAYLTL